MEHRFVTMKPMRPGVSGFARVEPEAGGATVQLHARGLRVKAVRTFWYREGGETRELGGARVNINGEASLTARLSAVAVSQGPKALLVVSDERAPSPLLCGLCSRQSAGALLDAKNALLALCERVRRENERAEAGNAAGERGGGNNGQDALSSVPSSVAASSPAPSPADIAVSDAAASPTHSMVAPPLAVSPAAPFPADMAVSDAAASPAHSTVAPPPSVLSPAPFPADIAVSDAAASPVHSTVAPPPVVLSPAPFPANIAVSGAAASPAHSTVAPPPVVSPVAPSPVEPPPAVAQRPLPRQPRKPTPRSSEPSRESFLPAIDPSPYIVAGETARPDDGKAPRAQTKSPPDRMAERAPNDKVVSRARPAAPPVDRLPVLRWPGALAPLKRHFDRLKPCAPLDLPGWRFVQVKPGLYVGRLARDGRVARVAYAFRLDAPPSDGRPYQAVKGLDGKPYQVLWQRAQGL